MLLSYQTPWQAVVTHGRTAHSDLSIFTSLSPALRWLTCHCCANNKDLYSSASSVSWPARAPAHPPALTSQSLCSHGNSLICFHSTCLLSGRHMETWHWQMRWKREREREKNRRHKSWQQAVFLKKKPAGEISEKHKSNTFHILLCSFLHQELCMSWNDHIFCGNQI